MPRNAKKPRPRLSIDELNAVLKEYRAAHPAASTEVYRYSPVSLRVRVVDPGFKGMNKPERSRQVWPLLRTLPDDVLSELSMVVLVSPDEVETSIASRDFDAPVVPAGS